MQNLVKEMFRETPTGMTVKKNRKDDRRPSERPQGSEITIQKARCATFRNSAAVVSMEALLLWAKELGQVALTSCVISTRHCFSADEKSLGGMAEE